VGLARAHRSGASAIAVAIAAVVPALAALAALAACRGGAEGRARRTHEVATCVDALERVPHLPPDMRLTAVARGCAPACPGLGPWADITDGAAEAAAPPGSVTRGGAAAAPRSWRRDWKAGGGSAPAAPAPTLDPDAATAALLDGCPPPCPAPRPAARDHDPWSGWMARCGTSSLGLGKERAYLASADWWILARVAAWLDAAHARPLDDSQLPAQIEHATLRATFPLPLPARDPAGRYALPPSRHGHPSDARLYVIVGDAEVRAGAVPTARVRGAELDVRVGPGGDFPGQPVDEGQVGQVVAEDAALLGGDGARPPLLLIDERAPVARVASVFAQLEVGRGEVAVAADSARAHDVLLERASPEFAAAPLLVVRDAGAPGAIAIRGFGDDRATTWAGLDDELDHFAAVNAPVRHIALVVEAPLTAAQLVAILDACAHARIASLIMPAS
jgi:hypothetical protein